MSRALTTPGSTTARRCPASIRRMRLRARQADHNGVVGRHGAAGQAGARAARDKRQAGQMEQPDDLAHLRSAARASRRPQAATRGSVSRPWRRWRARRAGGVPIADRRSGPRRRPTTAVSSRRDVRMRAAFTVAAGLMAGADRQFHARRERGQQRQQDVDAPGGRPFGQRAAVSRARRARSPPRR